MKKMKKKKKEEGEEEEEDIDLRSACIMQFPIFMFVLFVHVDAESCM